MPDTTRPPMPTTPLCPTILKGDSALLLIIYTHTMKAIGITTISRGEHVAQLHEP
jgi:hypothetical protein